MPVDVASRRAQTRYDPTGFYDEALDADGAPRHEYGRLLDALERTGVAAVAERVQAHVGRMGATFGAGTETQPFPVDPVPRLITAREWVLLEAALAQRALALNAFIADVYGDRQIVRAGIVPADVITGADHYELAMAGVPVPVGHAPVVGFDLVRGEDGTFVVLEDNLRTPSGLAYAAAVHKAVSSELAASLRLDRLSPDPCFAALGGVLAAAAGLDRDPHVALLSDGPENSAWYEHRSLARRLGIALVTPEKLRIRAGRLCMTLPSGRVRDIDVVYRRTDEDRLRDENGRPTWLAEMLLEPLRRGNLAVVNAPGSGVADDKLVHAYVEDMIRFYLRAEPLIESVRTYDLTRPEVLTRVIGRLSGLVVKPRTGHGGEGVFIGPHESAEARAQMTAVLRSSPQRFVAQDTVRISRHPTVVGQTLEPRHVDLRVFAIATPAGAIVVPSPLTRVALRKQSLIVNSSQGGGAKDTWILR
jgi:uncharacterized circularly permuted ATP-grasp superfamily protein